MSKKSFLIESIITIIIVIIAGIVFYKNDSKSIGSSDKIVLSIMEHHSNLVPWQKVSKATGSKLEYMYINEEYEIPDEEIEKKITKNTKVVGIVHISNASRNNK